MKIRKCPYCGASNFFDRTQEYIKVECPICTNSFSINKDYTVADINSIEVLRTDCVRKQYQKEKDYLKLLFGILGLLVVIIIVLLFLGFIH